MSKPNHQSSAAAGTSTPENQSHMSEGAHSLAILNTHLWLLLFLVAPLKPCLGQSRGVSFDDDNARRFGNKKPGGLFGGAGGNGPCGRDVNGDGRFLALQYVNVNYEYNCGGGGFNRPQQDGILSGHKPHFNKPILGGLSNIGDGGGFKPQKPFVGILGDALGSLGGQGGQAIPEFLQGVTSTLSRPFEQFANNNGGGLFGLGYVDGSILNSFADLFTNNRPPASSPGIQYLQENQNNAVPTVSEGSLSPTTEYSPPVDEIPVHEDPDEIAEAYNSGNSNRRKYVSAAPLRPQQYAGFNYNKVYRKFNRNVIRPLYQYFR